MYIKTANQEIGVRQCGGGYARYVEYHAAQNWGARVNWQMKGDAVAAYINRSSWSAICPHCGTSWFYEPPHPFFCAACMMQANDGLSQPVAMPEGKAEIERLLIMRPVPDNRNWWPWETIDMLITENLEHGIGV